MLQRDLQNQVVNDEPELLLTDGNGERRVILDVGKDGAMLLGNMFARHTNRRSTQ